MKYLLELEGAREKNKEEGNASLEEILKSGDLMIANAIKEK